MKKYLEKIMEIIFFISAMLSVVAIVLICFFLFYNGIKGMNKIGYINFIFGTVWRPSSDVYGILPMILGSIYATGISIFFGVPIGVLSAIYLSEFATDKALKILDPTVDLLAGIPSIVYGFFGLVVIVPFIRKNFGGSGQSLLAASIVLSIMILPTIIGISKASIKAVNRSYYEASLALGATHEESVFLVVVPAAKSGILAAVILGIGRAIGETMAVVMVAGNTAVIPKGLLRGVRTLTANIVIEMGYSADLHREALIATGVVLFVFILIINVLFSIIGKERK